MSKLLQRFMLVSDMHYTTDLSASELKKTHPESNASAATGSAFGKTQREKIEKVYTDIIRENNRSALDAVFVLGDLSIDDYDFRNLPINYCEQFKIDCLDRIPCKYYAIPGNHDSYPNGMWRSIFGTDREFAIDIDGSVFIMMDTFNSIPATSASGAALTVMNEDFLARSLEKFAGNRIFICAHYIEPKLTSTDNIRELIRESSDIAFLFRGHTHVKNIIDMGESFGSKRLVDIGGYGYCGMKIDDRYEFNIFDEKWAWGYQILEVYDDKILTYHVTTDNTYHAVNGDFVLSEKKDNEASILL